jgi:hypothetical protein
MGYGKLFPQSITGGPETGEGVRVFFIEVQDRKSMHVKIEKGGEVDTKYRIYNSGHLLP